MRTRTTRTALSVLFRKFFIMRPELFHMLMLFSLLPNRNAFASVNKRIVLTQPTVILVSYDGFRWDYMEKVHTPNLNFIASNGIKAKHLLNTFVTKTFPNHFTLVTGLYEESHGIVANTFFEPVFNDTFYGKLPPLFLILFSPYTNLRPSFQENK